MMPIHFAADGRYESLREPVVTPASAVFEIMLTDRLAQNQPNTDYFLATRSTPLARKAYRDNSPSEPQHQPALLVGQIMKTDVHALNPDSPLTHTTTAQTSIREAARVMLQTQLSALPVVDDSNQVIGIISVSDILRSIVEHAPIELWV